MSNTQKPFGGMTDRAALEERRRVEARTPRSYKFEVHTTECAEGAYTSDGQRFSTSEQADAAAKNLTRRWTLVKDYRVVPSDDAVTEPTKQQ